MYDPVYQNEIVSEIASDNCVLFIGSGLSVGANLPSWRDIIRPLAETIGCSLNDDFLTISQAYERKSGRPRLLEHIYNATNTVGRMPTKLHNLLPKLGIKTWITTNYDDLLEICLRNANLDYRLIVRDDDLLTASRNANILIKLHGDRNHPITMVVTKNDYFIGPLKNIHVWNKLKLELLQKTFLFLGYSLSDPDFNQIQAHLLYETQPNNFRKSYAILFGVDEIFRADLETRNVSVIDLGGKDGDAKTELLFDFLNQIVGRLDHIPRIPSEYHYGEEAEKIVPDDILRTLKLRGCRIVYCIEYLVYCEIVDGGQFNPVPQGWSVPKPPEYSDPKYECVSYVRSDEHIRNIWKGWTIGEKN